jgi:hypothetical protein
MPLIKRRPGRFLPFSKGIAMRKAVIAAAAGLLLVAGQAAAAGSTTATRIADRVGARAEAGQDQFAAFGAAPFFATATAVVVVVTAVYVAVEEGDGESD